MGLEYKIKGMIVSMLSALFLFSFFVNDPVLADKEPAEKDVKYVKFKGGLNCLIKFAKSQGDMINEAKGETKAYLKVKKAFEQGKLEGGQSGVLIKKIYGSPVITLPINNTDCESWIYKPGEESFFEGEKICLVFDKENRLVEWKMVTSQR